MITANYIFKEAIMTQGMKFYKTKSLESQNNINTYEDFINCIVVQNFGRYFFQIIYDEAVRTQKTYDEVLDKLRQETGLPKTDHDNMLEKEFEILKSVLETELLKIGIDFNEKINDAKLVELLRKVGSNEYEQELNLLEEWIEEVLEEISDSVSEDSELLPLLEVGASWEVSAFVSQICLPSSSGSSCPVFLFSNILTFLFQYLLYSMLHCNLYQFQFHNTHIYKFFQIILVPF